MKVSLAEKDILEIKFVNVAVVVSGALGEQLVVKSLVPAIRIRTAKPAAVPSRNATGILQNGIVTAAKAAAAVAAPAPGGR